MKANVKKAIEQLKPSEMKRIDDMLFDRLDEELIIAQFNWIRLGAWAWHLGGKSTEDIAEWLGNFKRLYQINSRFTSQKQLTEFLEPKMVEIFGDGGFPEEFMQSFRNIGRR